MKVSKLMLIFFTTVYFITSAIFVFTIYKYMYNNVLFHAEEKARIILNRIVAINKYVAVEMRPAVFDRLSQYPADKNYFEPKWMSSSYIIREMDKYNDSQFEDYHFNFSAVNARHPEHEADAYETEILKKMNADPNLKELTDIRHIEDKHFFSVMRTNVRFSKGCMRCHGDPADAPQDMVRIYGDTRGFNRTQGEISAVLSILIPMDKQLSEARFTTVQLSSILLIIYLATLLTQYFVVKYFVTAPLTRISERMTNISMNEDKVGETLEQESSYEINQVIKAFNSFSENLSEVKSGLVDKIREKTFELEQLNNDLEQRIKEEIKHRQHHEQFVFEQKKFIDMGQMLSAIAHQWRQPLNALSLFVQDVRHTKNTDVIDDKYVDFFETQTLELIQHMSDTIEDFRLFFMPNKNPEAINVIDSINGVFRLLEAQLKRHNIRYIVCFRCCDKGEELWLNGELESDCGNKVDIFITGYEGEFKQCIMNIVHNAKDAIVDVKSIRHRGEIIVDISINNDILNISISDNGTGIPEEYLEKIFDPYFTTKDEGQGTGIGLYTTRSIIETHMNGKIKAKTSEHGTVFVLEFKGCYRESKLMGIGDEA